jgi:hypothetical protein
MGWGPADILAGTWTFTWYKLTNPGARPLNWTLVTGWPPMVTVGAATVIENVVLDAARPSAGWFETGPSPFKYNCT